MSSGVSFVKVSELILTKEYQYQLLADITNTVYIKIGYLFVHTHFHLLLHLNYLCYLLVIT